MAETEVRTLNVGEVLFNKGDAGGDLFIIVQGEAEIYNVDGAGNEFILNVMKAGEIIGLASIVTRERRLASIRAKSKMVVKRIEHEKFAKLLQELPPWLKTIIKDMTLRLDQMNKQFSIAQKMIVSLKRTQISCYFLATQIAGTIAAIGEMISIQVDDKRCIVIDQLMDKLETILAIEKEIIVRIFDAFIECGVLRVQVEPDQKRKVVDLKNATDIASFVKFVQELRGQKFRKLRKSRLANKEIRILNGIVKLAVRMNLNLDAEITMPVEQIEKQLEKSLGIKYDFESLVLSSQVELLQIDSEQQNILFVPRQLSQILTNLSAYRRLEKMDQELWDQENAA